MLVKLGFGLVYVSGVVWVNGGLFCEMLFYVVKENGVKIKLGWVYFFIDGKVCVDGEDEYYDKLIIVVGVWLKELLDEVSFYIEVLV